jgi:plastocyanin
MKRIGITIGLLLLAVGLAACSGASGAAPSSGGSSGSGAPRIVAKDMKFQPGTVELAANRALTLDFTNQDGAPHNVAIYTDTSAAKSVFVGDVISNSTTAYQIPALAPGAYFFRCDVHHEMTGTLTANRIERSVTPYPGRKRPGFVILSRAGLRLESMLLPEHQNLDVAVP